MENSIEQSCLIFPFSRINANAISALLASLDIHPQLSKLQIFLPDLKSPPEAIEFDVEPYKNIILAFSVFSTQLDEIARSIVKYKTILSSKNLLVIAGGPHPIGDPLSMILNGADIVCTGEGEEVIRNIILGFLVKQHFSEIDGIAFIDEKDKFVKTSKPFPIDLGAFPPFSIKHKLFRPIEITRGCAWKCRFCQIRSRNGFPVRHRPISKILEFVKYTVVHFSKRRPDIRFISPNALSYGSSDGRTLDLNRVETLLAGIRNIIGDEGKIYFGSFPSEVRPETITKESVKILKKYSNVKTITVGGQSGSNKVLALSDRGHGKQETERATKLLLESGFEVDVDIIFGLPGEDDEAVKETREHMQNLTQLGAVVRSHTFLPLVGTPFASADPGVINEEYKSDILKLQSKRKLKGHHDKQEQEAQIIAKRRISEKHEKEKYKKNLSKQGSNDISV